MTETLIAPKDRDNFSSESPIRAFTDFQVSGLYAIGKGFRPSLGHLATYLDAMEQKEGWALVQVILPTDDAGNPTIVFHKRPKTLWIGDYDSLRSRPVGKSPLLGETYGETGKRYPDGGTTRGMIAAASPPPHPGNHIDPEVAAILARRAAKTDKPAMRWFITKTLNKDDLADALKDENAVHRLHRFASDIIDGNTRYTGDQLTYMGPNAGPDAICRQPSKTATAKIPASADEPLLRRRC